MTYLDSQFYTIWVIALLIAGLKNPYCFSAMVLITTFSLVGAREAMSNRFFPFKIFLATLTIFALPALLLWTAKD